MTRIETAFSTLVIALVLAVAATASAAPPTAWDKVVNKPSRFKVLKQYQGQAVLDTETGLIWELDSHGGAGSTQSQDGAEATCFPRATGGRLGWRLPAVWELATLVQPGANPPIPPGAPFLNFSFGPAQFYWTSSLDPQNTAFGLVLSFSQTIAGVPRDTLAFVWCVRGPGGPQP